MAHPDTEKLLRFYRAARSNPPREFVHEREVVPQPSFFSIAALERQLSNPLLSPAWINLVSRGQVVPLAGTYLYKTVQKQQLCFMDKRILDEHLWKGAAVVLEGLDILDPEINQLCAELDAGLPCSVVNCVAFFSQRENEAYRGHIDTDDVLVIQLSGEKRWRLFPRQSPREINLSNLTPQQMGEPIADFKVRPGDAMYVRSGVPHMCDTPPPHSLHLSFDLCDRMPTAEDVWRAAYARFAENSLPPYVPPAEVAKRLSQELGSEDLAKTLAQLADTARAQCRDFRERIGATRVTALARFMDEQAPSRSAGDVGKAA